MSEPSKELITGAEALTVLQWRVEPLTLGLYPHLLPGRVEASIVAEGEQKPAVEMPMTEMWKSP